MIMQKRDFEAVARAVRAYSKAHGKRVIMPDVLAGYLADEISKRDTGMGFDRDRFIAACKPEGK
jgi:hypothetical protein